MFDGLGEDMQVFLTALIIVTVTVGVIGGGIFSFAHLGGDTAIEPETGSAVTIDSSISEVPSGVGVDATTGYGADFGTDTDERYIDADVGDAWLQGNWSLLLTADLDDSVNQQAAYTALAFENETVVLQWQDGEWLAFYDLEGDLSVSVRVNATTAQTPVVIRWDDGANELTLETPDHSATATADSNSESRQLASDWAGMLDEARIVNASVTDADVDSYHSEPVAPLPDSEGEHTARLMLDEGEGSTSKLYYAGGSANLVNVGWTTGVEGPDLSQGTDYELGEEPFSLTGVSGGFLDDAPVAYVSWGSPIGGMVGSLVNTYGLFLLLLPLVLLAARVTDTI